MDERCFAKELDLKLNQRIINDIATKNYSSDDDDFIVTEAEWFPRWSFLRELKDEDSISATSSEGVSVTNL